MESLILIVGLFLLFWFKEPIKKVANLLNNTISTAVDTTEDTLQVYVNDVSVENNKKRGLTRKNIERAIDGNSISTQDEIDNLLKNLKKPTTQVQEESREQD